MFYVQDHDAGSADDALLRPLLFFIFYLCVVVLVVAVCCLNCNAMDRLQNHTNLSDTSFDREIGEKAGQKRQTVSAELQLKILGGGQT